MNESVVIVNHALCDLAITINRWAHRTGNLELTAALEAWVKRYNEVLDLEIAIAKDADG